MIYDIAIIGGGPGGYAAAFEASGLGKSVILFEKDQIGGTCLNKGCVPTKYLAYVAELKGKIRNAREYGLFTEKEKVDVAVVQERKEHIIEQLRNGLEEELRSCNINIVKGEAELITANMIRCNEIEYNVSNIIIATGSYPDIKINNPKALNSNQILNFDSIPKSISIIGGGVIAVEFAEIFRNFGCEVAIYIRGERLLRKWDKDIAIGLTQNLKKKGIKIFTKCDLDTLNTVDDELVFSALGRTAYLTGINKDYFDFGEDNGIYVDNNYQTKTKGVFAIGDVISNSVMLAHTAMEQGRQVVRYIVNNQKVKKNEVISCIYTRPEIACVGVTEKEAIEEGKDVFAVKKTMYANARTLISSKERSFVKCVVEKGTKRIIGAQLMCERATDIVSEFALAIQNGFSIQDMANNTRPHPSYVEIISELIELAERRAEE